MKGILVGSGNYFAKEKFLIEMQDADLLIAVDGGMDYYLGLNILPDVLIGDLDSISNDALKVLGNNHELKIIRHPVEKDSTDMELGLNYLMERNCNEVSIFGASGLRLDHSLANIFLLNILNEKGIEGKIIDENNTILLVDGEYTIKKEVGKYISLIPITPEGVIVSLGGFKYELDNYDMRFGSTIGVSNEIVQEVGYINIKKGKAVVFISSD